MSGSGGRSSGMYKSRPQDAHATSSSRECSRLYTSTTSDMLHEPHTYSSRRRSGFTSGAIALLLETALARRYPHEPPRFVRLGKPHRPLFDEAARRRGVQITLPIDAVVAEGWRDAIAASLPGARVGTFFADGRMIDTVAEKRALGARHGALILRRVVKSGRNEVHTRYNKRYSINDVRDHRLTGNWVCDLGQC